MEFILNPISTPSLQLAGRQVSHPLTAGKQLFSEKQFSEKQFVALYRSHYPELMRYAGRFVNNTAKAEDIVQESFLRLWKKRNVLHADSQTRALLYKSVRNLCLNAIRDTQTRTRLLQQVPESPPSPDPEAYTRGVLVKEQIDLWVRALPAKRREVFELSRYSQLSYKEIAEILDISIKTVENHLLNALRDLRDKINAFDPRLLKS